MTHVKLQITTETRIRHITHITHRAHQTHHTHYTHHACITHITRTSRTSRTHHAHITHITHITHTSRTHYYTQHTHISTTGADSITHHDSGPKEIPCPSLAAHRTPRSRRWPRQVCALAAARVQTAASVWAPAWD